MQKNISDSQALEVGRRLNPQNRRRIRFRANGTMIAAATALGQDWADIEIWECWHEEGDVRVQKVV